MKSLAYIPASDGAANASLMTVTNVRSPGATTILTNTVANAPTKFYGTYGTPHTFTDPVTGETITVISEATAVDFAGHIDSGHVEIDEIAPGYTDNGNEVGDIIVIRPVTEWANNISNLLNESLDDDGSIKKYFRDQFSDFVEYTGGVWSQTSGLVGTMTSGYVWFQGKRYAIAAVASKTFTASKDTYIDVDPATDTKTYVEVANNATEPAITADNVRIAKVVTGASTISDIDQTTYNAPVSNSQLQSNIFSGQIQQFTNTGTFGGTFYALDLGGLKLVWGLTNQSNVQTSTQYSIGVIFPTGFFSAAPAVTVAASDEYGTNNIMAQVGTSTKDNCTINIVHLNATSASAKAQVIAIGF